MNLISQDLERQVLHSAMHQKILLRAAELIEQGWTRGTAARAADGQKVRSTSATAISASQINLSWTDNSSNETGFFVERKTGVGGTYSQIATVGADVTSYSDTGLSASTLWITIDSSFHVRAAPAKSTAAR